MQYNRVEICGINTSKLKVLKENEKIEKEVNGKWYEVELLKENYGFNEIGYLPDKNNEVKFVIDWSMLYGELPLGNYRILKQVNNKYISIDFGIAVKNPALSLRIWVISL